MRANSKVIHFSVAADSQSFGPTRRFGTAEKHAGNNTVGFAAPPDWFARENKGFLVAGEDKTRRVLGPWMLFPHVGPKPSWPKTELAQNIPTEWMKNMS